MAKRLKTVFGALMVAALASCGFASSGDGTRTVEVQGHIACDFSALLTDIRFVLSLGNEPLAQAKVTLVDADSKESVEVTESAELGTYVLGWPGYHRRIHAHIWRDTDGLTFQIEAPGRHIVTAPAAGTLLDEGNPLDVRWQVLDGVQADYVITSLAAADVSHDLTQDRGVDRFASEQLQGASERVVVTRGNRLEPAGATKHSLVTSSYSVDATVVRRAQKISAQAP